MNNPHLTTLEIVETLSRFDADLQTIENQFSIGPATVKRYIAEARHLGADIVSVKTGSTWRYHLVNWAACKKITLRWIELEKARSLV